MSHLADIKFNSIVSIYCHRNCDHLIELVNKNIMPKLIKIRILKKYYYLHPISVVKRTLPKTNSGL